VAGVLVKPAPWLRIGAAYRGQLDLGLRLDIVANVDIAGSITGDTLISLRAVDFFAPHKVTLGVAADPRPWLTLSAEVSWLNWSAFTGAVPDLRILVDLDIVPPFVEGRLPRARFDDIWVPRIGAEARRRLHEKLAGRLRAGYAYTPSPVPDQTGLTNFADADRHTVALGCGLELSGWSRILPKPLRLDVAVQVHQLETRVTVKDREVLPGLGFVASGTLVYAGATLEAQF
jgi:long-chain fatty acid transport protein